MWDPNVRPQIVEDRDSWEHYHRRWSAVAHIYKASDEDFAWIWPSRTAASCAEELLAGTALAVLATRGADGVTVYTQTEEIDIASRPVDVVDTVGAGDTFVASVLPTCGIAALAADIDGVGRLGVDDWSAIARRAVDAAAITCSRPGADPPQRSEITP